MDDDVEQHLYGMLIVKSLGRRTSEKWGRVLNSAWNYQLFSEKMEACALNLSIQFLSTSRDLEICSSYKNQAISVRYRISQQKGAK